MTYRAAKAIEVLKTAGPSELGDVLSFAEYPVWILPI